MSLFGYERRTKRCSKNDCSASIIHTTRPQMSPLPFKDVAKENVVNEQLLVYYRCESSRRGK